MGTIFLKIWSESVPENLSDKLAPLGRCSLLLVSRECLRLNLRSRQEDMTYVNSNLTDLLSCLLHPSNQTLTWNHYVPPTKQVYGNILLLKLGIDSFHPTSLPNQMHPTALDGKKNSYQSHIQSISRKTFHISNIILY